jgi:hypothetical protein
MLMNLFAAALTYPTVWWTVALGIVVLYWFIVAGGGLEVDAMAQPPLPMRKKGLNFRQFPFGVMNTALALLNFWGCYFGLKFTGPVETAKGLLLMAVVFVVSLPFAFVTALLLRPLFATKAVENVS